MDENDIKALREEVAKLRERVAVLEAEVSRKPAPASCIDWRQPFMVGTPTRLVPMEALPPGTIICGAGGSNA